MVDMLNRLPKAQQLLLQGQQLRERGETIAAIDRLNRAIEAYIQEKNYSGFVRALLDRCICWQHMYQLNGLDHACAILYKKNAEAALEIAETMQLKDVLAGAHFMNGKAENVFENYSNAAEFFKKALTELGPERHAQYGDWQTNLGKSLYRNGDKEEGLQQMQAGLDQIIKYASEVDKYTSAVWLSGGYIRFAEILREDDPEQSAKYIEEAKKIIDSNSMLSVRKKQLENYLRTGNSGL